MHDIMVIETYESFLKLEDEWEHLRLKNGFNFFSSFDWYKCLILAEKQVIQPYIIVFKNCRNGNIEGILPLQRIKKFFFPGFSSLTNNDTPSFNFIIEKESELEIITSLSKYFHKKKYLCFLELKSVVDTYSPLNLFYSQEKRFCFLETNKQSPYLSCHQPFTEILKKKSKKSRQRTRNMLNRVDKLGGIKIEKLTHLESQDFEDLTKISSGSWKGEAGSSICDKETVKKFFIYLTETATQKKILVVWFLSVNGQRIAMEYHIREGFTEYALRGDYLSQYIQYSPGRFLDYQIINSLCEDKDIMKYDMCGDIYDYKMKWTKSVQKYYRIIWIGNPLIRLIYKIKVKVKSIHKPEWISK